MGVEVSVHNSLGQVVGSIQVSDAVFGIEPNEAVVHQALVRQRANARQGTADTKTRGEVAVSTAKIRRQKGLGRARQGSARAPHRRGGGVAFGPHPRSYRQALPKKMRRLALRSVLSAKMADGEVKVVEDFGLTEPPRTKAMAAVLEALKVDSTALVVTEASDPLVVRSARNLPGVRTTPAPLLNVAELLSHESLVMTVPAIRKVEALWAGPVVRPRRG